MIMRNKIKYLMFVSLALVLAISLVAGACAKAVPEEGAEAELQAKLAAEKAKSAGLEDEISDLEAEIEALRAPAKVWHWYPATWGAAGLIWDQLTYISDMITEASGGRIICEPTAPGALCPLKEQVDFVASGATDAMMPYPDHYSGRIPMCVMTANACYLLDTAIEMRHYLEGQNDGRVLEMTKEEFAKQGNVVIVGPAYYPLEMILLSRVPIDSIDDVDGIKFRCGDVPVANAMGKLGAAVVWSEPSEIYTMLATGAIDAVTYGSTSESLDMGFHEVTKYWLKSPVAGPVVADLFIVNGDVWQELPDELRPVVKGAIEAGNAYMEYHAWVDIQKGWIEAEEYGIEVVEWSEADVLKWKKAVASFFPEYSTDEASIEAVDILKDFIKEWKPKLAEEIGLD